MKATHIRLKTKQKVVVSRVYDTVVVTSLKGSVLGSYTPNDMALFNKRYKPIKIVGREPG